MKKSKPKRQRKAPPKRRNGEVRAHNGAGAKREKLFIVSADAAARIGLRQIFEERCREVSVCGVSDDAVRALAQCLAVQPSAVFIDVDMSGGAGWRLLADLHRKLPKTACVARLSAGTMRGVLEASRTGALTLCTLTDGPDSLSQAMEHALAKEVFFSPTVQAILKLGNVAKALAGGVSPKASLGQREMEAYRLLGWGHDTQTTADKMGIHRKSVQAHCEHIKTKLGLRSHVELCQRAALAVGRWV